MNYDIRQLFDIPLKGSTVSLQQYDRIYLFELFGIPINATIVSTWIVILVLFLISFLATRNLKADVHVGKFQTLLEWMVTWLNDEVKETSGDSPSKYMGMGLALFLFVLMSNLMTIIPWFRPPTASLSTTFAMALRLFGNMLSGIVFASVLTSFLPFFVPLSMQVLGLLTGSIQAYIFALLAVVYTSGVAPEQADDLTNLNKGELNG